MRKKLILFLMLALFGSTSFLRADVTSYGFEDGLPGCWTVLDANSDGYTWCLTSAIPTTWTYYASVTLDWYRTGTNAICSGSYINGVGAITPDDYLVTPQVTLSSGSSFSFWAASADGNYPAEHFGVFVSDNGTSGWTSVQEWTLTAKSGGPSGGRASRDGSGAKLATWYEFSVDLSSYAGDKYIAIRHFNCNDQYIMCVDDITINGVVHDEDCDQGGGQGGQIGDDGVITIGEGGTTSTGYLPTYNLYNYSLTQQIYTAEEIGTACNINSIAFHPLGSITRSLDIYMVNTDKASFAGGNDWITVTEADRVYSGSVSMAPGWTTITLDAPFAYNGTDNLAIIVNDLTGSWVSSISYSTFAATAQAIRIYQDSAPYDPYNPSAYNGTVMDQKNQLQLGTDASGEPEEPEDPWEPDYSQPLGTIEIVNPQYNQANMPDPVTLRWKNAENAHFMTVEFGSVYGQLETLIQDSLVTRWNGKIKLDELGYTIMPNTRYYWRVINTNDTGSVEASSLFTGTFSTATNVKVIPDQIFTGDTTLVKWNIVGGGISELPETTIGSGSGSTNYFPTYNLYNYSLTQQIYTLDEIGNAGIINSVTFLPESAITRNLDVYMVNTDKESFSGSTDWITVTEDDLVFSGSVAMAAPQTTITLETPFVYDGTNLAIIVNDLTGSWTSSVYYASFDATAQGINIYQDAAAYNPLAPTSYSGTVRDYKNQIILNTGAKGNRDLLGCNVYVDSTLMNTDGLLTEREYVLTTAHMEELGVTAYNMDGHAVNVTGVYDYGESDYSATVLLYVSGYTNVNGTVAELMTAAPIEGVTVKLTGKDEFNNTQTYQTVTNAEGAYAFENVKCGTYDVKATYDAYEPVIIEDVELAHDTNPVVIDILYMHETYAPVYDVYAAEGDILGTYPVADITWSFNYFDHPGGSGGGGGGNGGTFTEGFEGGMPEGWTVIDANNDGYTWTLTSAIPSTWTYYASLTLDWYRTGTNAICSGSYINGVGAITPDEYLVTNQVNIGNGSTFSFWAAATDASYPADHFGVFVSDNGTSDWTMVNEWTLTAKKTGENGGIASRNGKGDRIGSWHQYSVDLSAYGGQKYIAIRHFNCNDQYIMCVDDIELSNGSKSAPAYAEACGTQIVTAPAKEMWDLLGTVSGTSAGQQAVATDGTYIYTASWQTTPTGGHTFYQYDMEGNFIEGFEIAGATGIRDLTTDGEYFYGSSGGAQIFVLDFESRTLVNTITCSGLTSRHLTYDPERDGFWSGNWTTLDLYSRTGALIQSGPAPTSAYGSAYYKDDDNVEHLLLFCQPNSDAKVYDFNIATNTISGPIFDYAALPGYNGIAGGCFIADYGDKLAFYGNLQQDPNLIGIYEIGDAQGGGGSGSGGGSQLATDEHFFRLYRKPVLLETMPEEPEEPLLIADEYGLGFVDTVYTDMEFAAIEAGVYQYGVAAIYPWMERNDNNVTEIVWSNYIDCKMKTTMTINGTCNIGSIEGALVTFTNLDQNGTITAELNEDGIWVSDEFRKGHYIMTVTMDGYMATYEGTPVTADGIELNLWVDDPVINLEFEEYFAPVSSIVVSQTGFARWTDMLPHDRIAQRYHVMCNEIFQGETEENFMMLNTDNLVNGQTYTASVAVVYETGMSDFVTTEFTYMTCDYVSSQITDLNADVNLTDVTLSWTATNGGTPPPPPPGNGSSFTEGFESGMPAGWTVIDANNDGYTWCMTSAIPSTWTYYASLSLDWYHTGTNAICSGSYINGVGALTPDEYLVTNQVTLASGSTFKFWAAATDASYPADHFGVFVSDNGTSNWTMVNEWTLTGKSDGGNGGRASRDGNGAKIGTWHQFSVDLSAYAGEKYIAIRHFNCNDQYIMCVDDIELTSGSKSGNLSAAGHGFGPALNGLTDDGNWYYYDNGINDDAIGTGGGNFWWGIMLPAGSYQGTSLTKVAAYDYMAMTGTATIYQGGSSAPSGSALGTVNVTFTGSEDFVEFPFSEAVTLDPSQNVWVVFYNASGATYPAAVCSNTGDPNGRWVSLDGISWEDLASYSLDYTFMVRAYIETSGGGGGGGGGTVTTSITPNAFNIFQDGVFIGATTAENFTWVEDDSDEHEYCVYFVDANYNFSCVECISVAADPLGVGQYNIVSAIYPNPTNGNLYVNTNAYMKSINIVNMLGQVVYNKATEGTETVIDMAQFDNGVYMINIVTENGNSVQRIIVNK